MDVLATKQADKDGRGKSMVISQQSTIGYLSKILKIQLSAQQLTHFPCLPFLLLRLRENTT